MGNSSIFWLIIEANLVSKRSRKLTSVSSSSSLGALCNAKHVHDIFMAKEKFVENYFYVACYCDLKVLSFSLFRVQPAKI